jgi:hypothetical protein
MTPMRWTAGCLVIVASVLGGLVSSRIVNEHFPTSTHRDSRDISKRTADPPTQNLANLSEDRDQIAPRGNCVTLGGKQFEWPFANVPFAAMSCSH